MKKLTIVALLMLGITTFAQENNRPANSLTPEQRTELRVKKLTLDLDLTEAQQKQFTTLFQSQQNELKALKENRRGVKTNDSTVTSDQKFEARTAALDRKIAHKQHVKKILTPSQYEKWEKQNDQKQNTVRNRVVKEKMGKKQVDKAK